MKKHTLLFSILLASLSACNEESVGQYPTDNIAPGPVTNITVKEIFGGGVKLAYTIPDDADLQGIIANYTLDTGRQVSVMVSSYTREITLEGFATETEHSAELRAIDKSRNLSEPVIAKFTPKRAPIFDVYESLKINSDFGGAKFTWENPEMKDIIVSVSKPISKGSEVEEDLQNFYSSAPSGEGFVRGLDAVPVTLNVVISDQYGNTTEKKTQECLPLYEEKIQSTTYWKKWNGDKAIPYKQYSGSYPIEKMWDGIKMGPANDSKNMFHLPAGSPFPVRFTFDMNQVYKLSRMKVAQRALGWAFEHGNPKRFQVYGSLNSNVSVDATEPERQWIFLGEFTSFKPSGLPLEQASAEDEAIANEGEDFTFPIELATEVRYIRFDILETWGGTEMVHISELEMWGQPEGYSQEKEGKEKNETHKK